VDAVLFALFGTVVDWHGVVRDGEKLFATKRLDVD